jgi:Phage integrase, N-terminal SAM-like domain
MVAPAGVAKERRPKSANGNGGARLRANGSWEWRESLPDGRRFSGYGKTQMEAKGHCLAKVKQAERGIDVKAIRQTVGHYLDWWLKDVVTPKLAPKTIKAYTDVVRLHLTPGVGRIELGKLTPQAVTSLLRKKERDGLSPRSVAMIREVLRGALNTAVKMQMVERNAAALAESPRQVKAERRMLTPEEGRRLLRVVESDRLAALYRLALTLGMRQGEILGLRWAELTSMPGCCGCARRCSALAARSSSRNPRRRGVSEHWRLPHRWSPHCSRTGIARNLSESELAQIGRKPDSSLPRRWAHHSMRATSRVNSSIISLPQGCQRSCGSTTCATPPRRSWSRMGFRSRWSRLCSAMR